MIVFVGLWAACASYVVLANMAACRRALRLRTFSVPTGVLVRQPTWPRIRTFVEMTAFAALLASAVAAVGFPSVAVGVLLPIVGTSAFSLLLIGGLVVGLTFEVSGFYVHFRKGARLFIPQTSVVTVSQTGPAHYRRVNVEIIDPGRTITSVEPDTARNRGVVHLFFEMGKPPGGALAFDPWTCGLDSDTLTRLLCASLEASVQVAN